MSKQNLVVNSNQLEVDSKGCRITALLLNGKAILWSGKRPDGKEAASHPCLPYFGKPHLSEFSDLPQHGTAREQEWVLINSTKNTLEYSWEMPSLSEIYPEGLQFTRFFLLTDHTFNLKIKIKNNSTQPLPINPGEHCYFYCLNKDHGEVLINEYRVEPQLLPGTIYLEMQTSNEVIVPQIGKLKLELEYFHKVAVWSLPGADYICIEPIGSEPNAVLDRDNLLNSGEEKVFSLSFGFI